MKTKELTTGWVEFVGKTNFPEPVIRRGEMSPETRQKMEEMWKHTASESNTKITTI